MYESLQPLRIPAGWTITRNLFYEEEIDPTTMDTVRETLFHAINEQRRRALDLEWVPEQKPDGGFELKVVNITAVYNEKTQTIAHHHDWDAPYHTLQTTDRQQLIQEMNRLMWQVPVLPEERLLTRPGVTDEPSESFRLAMQHNGLSQALFESIMAEGNHQVQHILVDHPDVQPEMLETIINSDCRKGLRKKAATLLNSKRYKKAHNL
jgi:hypothetical protein